MIVFAKDESEAFNIADETYLDLCNAEIFDYYNMFDGNDQAEDRWGKIPKCIDCTSKFGIEKLEEALNWTLTERLENIVKLRKLFDEHSNEEFVNNEGLGSKLSFFSWYLSYNDGYLYDQFGETIKSGEEFRKIFLEQAVKNIYLIPADVHY